ncbi:hypothetical protein, partial [Nonomuraea sp. KC401]|uniref:hypothetical protein n=1 Tax=Nonomuraea sp. KC401 TaxID=1848324 RepID=UPI001BB24815
MHALAGRFPFPVLNRVRRALRHVLPGTGRSVHGLFRLTHARLFDFYRGFTGLQEGSRGADEPVH